MIFETAAAISGVRPGASRASASVVVRLREEPIAEIADREVGDRREGRLVVGVDDEARDLVGLVGDHRLVEKAAQRQVGEGHLGGDVLRRARRGDAGEHVAGAGRSRLGEQVLQVGEDVGRAAAGAPIHA